MLFKVGISLASYDDVFRNVHTLLFIAALSLSISNCSSLLQGSGSGSGDDTLGNGAGGDGAIGDSTLLAPRGPFIDDQMFVIPETAVVGDIVGRAKPYPTVTLTGPTFSITAGNIGNIFSIDPSTGMITVSSSGALDAGSQSTYELTIEVEANGSLTDSAIVTVEILDESTIVFIDPDNTGDPSKNGSLLHPYSSFSDFSLSANKSFLLKRGSSLTLNQAVHLGYSNVLLGAYGVGDRPYIHFVYPNDGHKHAFYNTAGPQNVTVRDLEIYAPADADSCVRFGGVTGNDGRIENNVCHGSQWGFRAFNASGLKVLYNEVYDILEDGIFIQSMNNIEVAYNDVHHVNQAWVDTTTTQNDARGDAIQLGLSTNNWHVHHNNLDRRDTGNKFCFISNGVDQTAGIFEHNLLRGPRADGDGGASIFFGSGANLIVRYNVIGAPSPTAIYNHSEDLSVYGNVVYGAVFGLRCLQGSTCTVNNNVFHDMSGNIKANGTLHARNNIFSLVSPADEVFTYVGTLDADYNIFTRGPTDGGDHSFVADPLFTDVENFDFSLQEGSPAIDAGVEVGDRGVDNPVIGGTPDIGAIEFGSES